MIVRSRAPLRLGLAGGGTDVAPYSELYGGAVLNATINMYAYATIIPRNDETIYLHDHNTKASQKLRSQKNLPINHILSLHKGVYNRIVREFSHKPLSFELSTFMDAPPGSGLGTSSTLVVTILGAFTEWLNLPLGEYDIARIAYEIERKELAMAGGKQDQYAATFGGVNFMEFDRADKVIVNPLRIRESYLNELSYSLVLYYTETSRDSSRIIESQVENVQQNRVDSIEAMHQLKRQAVMMKEALLKGDIDEVGRILDFGWQYKKQMAAGITNPSLDAVYEAARKSGASGGKISGAGGGGYMTFYCPENTRAKVIDTLKTFGGRIHRYDFTSGGLTAWTL